MSYKPELIIISQNLLGGGTSFNRNMLSCFPDDFFDIRTIYLSPLNWNGAKAFDIKIGPNDTVFSYGDRSVKETAGELSKLILNGEGAIVANLELELICLDLHKNRKKTVFFICHDDGFLHLAIKYQNLIDVFIAHNIAVYNVLATTVGKRNKDVFFIQHGVRIPSFEKTHFPDRKLKIVFLARHYEYKGVYDLPVINELLVRKGVDVEWMVLGDGPERNALIRKVDGLPNFQFYIPVTPEDVIERLKDQDIFILPSRKDGLPVALLESMSVGCVPLIANFSEGIKKVVTDDIGFVLPAGENELFAEKIALLAADRKLLRELSHNCVTKVKKEFDIEKQAMEYYKLYTQYKEFKKDRVSGLSDLLRRLEYSENFNKLVHAIRSFKTRLINKKAMS